MLTYPEQSFLLLYGMIQWDENLICRRYTQLCKISFCQRDLKLLPYFQPAVQGQPVQRGYFPWAYVI